MIEEPLAARPFLQPNPQQEFESNGTRALYHRDGHGRRRSRTDATKAAKRAVSDAIRHSSLGFFRMLGKTANDMFVDVTIGVPDPGAVDTSAVAKELPYGTVTVTAVKGGLEIPAEQGGDAIIIANAAVIVSLDDGCGGVECRFPAHRLIRWIVRSGAR